LRGTAPKVYGLRVGTTGEGRDARGATLAKTFGLTLGLAAAALALTACAARADKRAQDSNPTRELFQRNCAMCHGPDGRGRQVGTLSVPSLHEGRPATDPDERLFTQVHDGGNGMPPFKYTLTDEQIQDLVRFVREEMQGRAPSKR
jgi:mono/diheme cytochrome c family protein